MSKFDINSLIGTPDALKNTVRDIPIESLVPYSKHCFKLYSGERLDDMVQSIAKNGVITPIIARKMDKIHDGNKKYKSRTAVIC